VSRKYHGARLPSKTAVKASLDFLNLGNQDDFITQCNDCIHAFNAPYRAWCDFFNEPPTGECMKRTVKSKNKSPFPEN